MAAAAGGSGEGEKDNSAVVASAVHVAPVTSVPCTPALVPVAPADASQRGRLSPGQVRVEPPRGAPWPCLILVWEVLDAAFELLDAAV